MKNYVNVVFGSGEWKFNHRKEFTKAIANEMKDVADTIVIDAPVSLSVNLFIKFKERLLRYLKGNLRPTNVDNGIKLFTPFILTHLSLWKKLRVFNKIDSLILALQVEKFLKKENLYSRRLLWVYLPEHVEFAKFFKHHYLIYDCYDDNEFDYDGNRLRKESKLNKMLVKKCDLTMCVAKYTCDRFKQYNRNVIYLPNGNSYDIFKNSESEPRKDFVSSGKPIIGYLGTIRNWIDFNLIEYLLQNLKEYQLVFLGMVSRNARKNMLKLKKYCNFTHIEFVEFPKVPSYVKAFQVGIIPFRLNNFTLSVFPYKFFEYMAAGIPIVTTALPEMKNYSAYIGFSESRGEFLKNCIDAVKGEFKEKIKLYPALAKENSWESRTIQLLKEINTRVVNLNSSS